MRYILAKYNSHILIIWYERKHEFDSRNRKELLRYLIKNYSYSCTNFIVDVKEKVTCCWEDSLLTAFFAFPQNEDDLLLMLVRSHRRSLTECYSCCLASTSSSSRKREPQSSQIAVPIQPPYHMMSLSSAMTCRHIHLNGWNGSLRTVSAQTASTGSWDARSVHQCLYVRQSRLLSSYAYKESKCP